MLVDFALEAKKCDGQFYPPRSIANLLHVVNRLIHARQETRASFVPINIFKNPIYKKVKVVGDVAAMRSNLAGLGITPKRSDTNTWGGERYACSHYPRIKEIHPKEQIIGEFIDG